MTMSPFCIPKVVKSATKILKIGSLINNIMLKNHFEKDFLQCENTSKGSNYFPGKTHKIIPQIC